MEGKISGDMHGIKVELAEVTTSQELLTRRLDDGITVTTSDGPGKTAKDLTPLLKELREQLNGITNSHDQLKEELEALKSLHEGLRTQLDALTEK